MHPFIKEMPDIDFENDDFYFDLSSEREINDLLFITDILITDYSSVIFEYSFFNKPVIFYTPDYKDYDGSRGFYYPFSKYTYGDVAKNNKELINSIKKGKVDKKKLKEEFWLLLPYFLVLAVATFFILVLQKDLGQVVVLAVTLMVLGTFAGTSKRFFASLSGVGVLLLIAAIITQPHRIRRFQSWWVTNQDAILKMLPSEWAEQLYITGAEEPYQITHSLNAIYHGGFFGTGLGGGTFKLGFLSEVHTDFVLAGIAEEIGFIGLIGVSAILLFIIFRILKISSRSFNNNVYHLFSLGIAVIITVAFLMNAYGITSLIPIKGIAVPFLSYGGSSVLALSIAVGMVLMVSKKVDLS